MSHTDSTPIISQFDGEPCFLIRAIDPIGPDLVEEWCRRYRKRVAETTGNFTPEQARKHVDNLNHAIAMADWRSRTMTP